MATADARRRLRERPMGVTILLTIVGYALVVGTFLLDVPIYPDLTNEQVNLLSHLIAGINTTATVVLTLGWYWIRNNEVEKHRLAMVSGFVLILGFLVVYLLKVGGGGTKEFVGPDIVYYPYLLMLAIHILLSIVSVPVVLYALILGVTHTPAELRSTVHARVGRIAAASWILSLVLGVVTYVLLNHVYSYEFASLLVPVF
jgi:putative membrane protein